MEHSRRVRPRRRREPPRPPTPAIVNPRGQPPYRPGIDPDLPRAGRRLGPYGPRTGHAARPPSNRSFRAEDDEPHVLPTAPSANKAAAEPTEISTYVHDACTRPAYARLATVNRLAPPR